MRSRYVAYTRGAVDHLIATHDPVTRRQIDRDAVARQSRDTRWLGLDILACERGGADQPDGAVEFVARGVLGGAAFAQHERSRFRRIDDRWYYVDGTLIRDPVRAAATAGRNDPCPCGSGRKYKRCHGAG